MIWQLMKRDSTWMGAPIVALLALLPVRHPAGAGLLVFVPVVALGWNVGLNPDCTVYEGALPIRGRDLWLSRVIALLAIIWLPVLSAALLMLAAGSHPSAPLTQAAALFTVLLLAIKCLRPGYFSVPQWVRSSGFILGAAAYAGWQVLGGGDLRIPSAAIVLAVCGLASAVLVPTGWSRVPQAFQIVPARPAGWGSGEARRRSRFVWSPVFRSMFRWQMWFMLFLLVSQLAIGSGFFPFIYVPVLVMNRATLRWLSPLPVASRTLFRLTLAPLAGAIVVATVVRFFVDQDHPMTPRTRIVELAVELAILCFLLWLVELIDWRGFSKLKPPVRGIPLAAGMVLLVVPMVAGAFSHIEGIFWMLDGPLRVVATALPENVWLLAPTLIAPLAAVYWLAEKTYGEMEYPRVRTTEPLK